MQITTTPDRCIQVAEQPVVVEEGHASDGTCSCCGSALQLMRLDSAQCVSWNRTRVLLPAQTRYSLFLVNVLWEVCSDCWLVVAGFWLGEGTDGGWRIGWG